MRNTPLGFVRQQGFAATQLDRGLYTALMFQPRVIGGVVLIGAVTQSPWLFLTLSAVLWLSALAPAQNPFNVFHNRLLARRWQQPRLDGAPPPRRFAMFIAAAMTLTIAAGLLAGATTTAWVVEGLFAAAVAAVVGARFCTGSYLHYLLFGATAASSACVRA